MDRETAVLLDWYRIRDTFLGENGIPRNVVKALKLASSCEHEDAQWLFHVCADGRVKSKEEAITAFELVEEFDARALCFGWVLRPDRYITRLRRSAELGYAFAQARLAEWKDGDERAKLANTAVRAGERLGFFVLGTCFRDGEGCERSSMKARENFLVAAELGDIVAMDEVGHLLENSDPRKWFWWGHAGGGASFWFLNHFSDQIVKFFSEDAKNGGVVFAIGKVLDTHMNAKEGKLLNRVLKPHLVTPANRAVSFFKFQLSAARKAVDAWTLVGIRFGIVKDVRKMIGGLIWERRHLAEYTCGLQSSTFITL